MKKMFPFLFLLCGCGVIKENIANVKDQFEDPSYIITADLFLGFHEYKNRQSLREFLKVDPVSYEWCAAFVNASLNTNGIPGSESVSENPLLARSFLSWGYEVDEPQLGDIVVFPRGNAGWQGHVGFYILTTTMDGVEYYAILGGNQSDEVSYELYPASSAIGIRRQHGK